MRLYVRRHAHARFAWLQTKRTLRMLYNDHSKAGKELQRQIAKLREENKDPNLPQKPPSGGSSSSGSARPATLPTAPSPPPHARNRLSDSQQTVDESFMLLGHRVSMSLLVMLPTSPRRYPPLCENELSRQVWPGLWGNTPMYALQRAIRGSRIGHLLHCYD